MNRVLLVGLLVGWLLFLPAGSAMAEDGRLLQIEMQQKRAQLLAQAEAEKRQATVEAEAGRARLLADKKALQKAVAELRTKNQYLQKEIKVFQEELAVIKVEAKDLKDKLAAIEGEIWELVGSIRVNARELDSRLRQSLQSAFYPDREQVFQAIMGETRFPGMDEIRILTGVVFDEIAKAYVRPNVGRKLFFHARCNLAQRTMVWRVIAQAKIMRSCWFPPVRINRLFVFGDG